MVITDSLIEAFLPNFVYKIKITKATAPNERKIHAKTHKTSEGPRNDSSIGF